MNKNDFLIWEQASKDTIDFKKVYVDVAEDLIAGLLLSQIVYWNLPNKEGKTKLRVKIDGELWLAKGREDWWEEIRISAKQFDRASKILIEKGIIEKKLKKFDGLPTIHIKLNFDVLLKGIDKVLKPQPENEVAEEMAVSQDSVGFDQKSNWDLPNGENGICPKVKKGFDQRVNSITENTNKDYNKDYIHNLSINNKDNNINNMEEDGLIDSNKSNNNFSSEVNDILKVCSAIGFRLTPEDINNLLFIYDKRSIIEAVMKSMKTGTAIAEPFAYILTVLSNKQTSPAPASKPNEEINAKAFNNFEAREYDYDSLEKKLLGWE